MAQARSRNLCVTRFSSCFASNMPLLSPTRGSYWEQTLPKTPGVCKLPWYSLPPSRGGTSGIGPVAHGVDQGFIFGPVHASEETDRFVSIQVPAPWKYLPEKAASTQNLERPNLIWINILRKKRDREGQAGTIAIYYTFITIWEHLRQGTKRFINYNHMSNFMVGVYLYKNCIEEFIETPLKEKKDFGSLLPPLTLLRKAKG